MSVKGEAYYIGPGVFHFGGVDYGYGKKLPADVPTETITAMKNKVPPKVSDTPPSKVGAPGMGELGTLRDKVQELTVALDASKEETNNASAALVKADEEIERLQDQLSEATRDRDAARNTITDLNKTVEELTTQLMNPAPAGEGAGPAPVAPAAPAKGGKK